LIRKPYVLFSPAECILYRFDRKFARWVVGVLALALIPHAGWAGSIFLTGHDPDFPAFPGGNTAGATKINQVAIDFVTDPGFNTFSAAGVDKFPFVQSSIAPPSGHVDGENGITASGFVAGTDFETHDATTLNAELDQLGTKYSAIVVASDFGGILTQAELNVLNSRSTDIIKLPECRRGLYAMAESNSGAGLTPGGGHFGYLPFIVSSIQANQSEIGFTVTPFGASLGLTDADINGNASHNIFNDDFGLNIVDLDSDGRILSLAVRAPITPGGARTWCGGPG
jgi:hypothetical protein